VHRPFSASHPFQAYRLRLANSVEACACYARGVRDILAEHLDGRKLFVAQNAMDTRQLFGLFDRLSAEGREGVRKRLGIGANSAVLVFVGQLVPRKGTRELIDTFAAVQKECDATLLVIGDGPERPTMEAAVRERNLKHVQFLGALPLIEQSAPYVFAADMTVIPGYVGLVANHSLCLVVPLVTQEAPDDLPFHGPEVESVIDGVTGFVTRRDPDALLEGVKRVLSDREDFADRAIRYARDNLTSEGMVRGLVGAIDYAADQVSRT
jgi:glycosyltransferase involved in cell wall biosynthesis